MSLNNSNDIIANSKSLVSDDGKTLINIKDYIGSNVNNGSSSFNATATSLLNLINQ